MSPPDEHAKLYELMAQVIGDMKSLPELSAKYTSKAFMDLNLDVLHRNSSGALIALSHYYEQNGDLVPDPDMQFQITYPTETQPGTAQAVTYQDTYTFEDEPSAAHQRFAMTWMTNLIQQGHQLSSRDGQDTRPPATPAQSPKP